MLRLIGSGLVLAACMTGGAMMAAPTAEAAMPLALAVAVLLVGGGAAILRSL